MPPPVRRLGREIRVLCGVPGELALFHLDELERAKECAAD
jgi:hypothetical protein